MPVRLFDTERLEIVGLDAEAVNAALTDRQQLETQLNARLDPEWPMAPMEGLLRLMRDQFLANPLLFHWGGVIVLKSARKVIGDAGFHRTESEDGVIELGYSVVGSERGQGVATEAVRGMLKWAFARPRVTRIIARVERGNIASIRVLEKAGFLYEGLKDDQRYGSLHYYAKLKTF